MLFAANFDRNMTTEVPTRCSLMKSDNQHSLKAFPSPSNIRWGGQTQRTANEKHQKLAVQVEILITHLLRLRRPSEPSNPWPRWDAF